MDKRRTSVHRLLQLVRIFSQVFFFGLFFYLLLGTHFSGKDYIGPVESFFHFDPLVGLAASIASWALPQSTLVVVALP